MVTRRRVLQAGAIQGLTGCFGSAFAQSKSKDKPTTDSAHDQPSFHPDERLNRLLAPIRDAHHLPGLLGAVLANDRLVIGAVGIRKMGSAVPIQVTDQVHIGSNTKAMTATLIGTLVDEGKLKWGSTIRDIFPDFASQLHPEFQAVTLDQFLTHRAGLIGNQLPDNAPPADERTEREFAEVMRHARSTTEKRRGALKVIMKLPPVNKPGSTFLYSNVSYEAAGAMAEQATGQSWETMMIHRLFEPLGMASAGFGSPGRPGEVDQPWGHRPSGDRVEPTREDLSPFLGPAAAMHCSIPDWSKFAALHLEAARGKANLLKLSTFRVLHTPPAGFIYAGGWIVLRPQGAGGSVLHHDGSNRAWFATTWLAVAQNVAILLATNQGGGIAQAALNRAFLALIRSPELPEDVFAPL